MRASKIWSFYVPCYSDVLMQAKLDISYVEVVY